MKKKLLLLLVISISIQIPSSCALPKSFELSLGNKPSEIGFEVTQEEPPFVGPVAIEASNDRLYILDEINLRVSVYSFNGQYVESYPISNNELYYDLAIGPQGEIVMVTNKGVFSISKSMPLKKIANIPDVFSTPNQISTDKFGNVIISGINKSGRIASVLLDSKGRQIKYSLTRMFLSNSGLILDQKSNIISVMDKNKKIFETSIGLGQIPFGISDNGEVFIVERLGVDVVIRRIFKKKNDIIRKLKFNSLLIFDDSSYITYFTLSQVGKIAFLEVTNLKCRVTLIDLSKS